MRHLYSAIGWPGVVLLMAIESCGVPVPSEVIMPFAGWFLVLDKGHGFLFVIVAALLGALGNTIGSVVAYYIGDLGGRPLVLRFGRFLLLSQRDLDRAEAFFDRRGALAVLVSRVLPVVRTFISFPAGFARMHMSLFAGLTFVGSFVWSLGLCWAGYALGSNWDTIRKAIRPFDYPIAALIVAGIVWLIWHHIRRAKAEARNVEPAVTHKPGEPPSAGTPPVHSGPYPPTRYAAGSRPVEPPPTDDDPLNPVMRRPGN